MKKRDIYIVIILSLLGLIFLYPWFQIFLGLVGMIFLWSYSHYWTEKEKYGPYMHFKYDPSSTIMINWVAVAEKYQKKADQCFVELSQKSSFETNVRNYVCKSTTLEKSRMYYHILVDNLTPLTTYYYRIILDDEVIFSNKSLKFTTGPSINTPVEDKPISKFIIYGDDQTADFVPVLAQLVNHAQYKERPEFMVHLGDINQNLWNLHENNVFFTSKKKIFSSIPYMPVVGNHDAKPITQYDAFYDIDHWYCFEYGSLLRCVILTGHHSFAPESEGGVGQYEFLHNQLQKAQDKNQFIIICIHRSAFHIQHKRKLSNPSTEIQKYLVPLVEKFNNGLQKNVLWFNGHQHDYCRVVHNDMTYITIGACSNAKSYLKLNENEDTYFYNEIAEKEYGRQSYCLLILDSRKKELIVEPRNILRKPIERLKFTLN